MGKEKAVVLLSGGMESAVTLAIATNELGYDCSALTFDYGQTARHELRCADWQADHFHVSDHRTLTLPFSGLIGGDIIGGKEVGAELRPSYVPARNLIFLSIAAAYAESIGAEWVLPGFEALTTDEIYPDTTPEFVLDLNKLLRKVTPKVRAFSLLADMSVDQYIPRGEKLGVLYEHTWSCYDNKPRHCGVCHGCAERIAAFKAIGMEDPVRYMP